jgi:hypothetical protein
MRLSLELGERNSHFRWWDQIVPEVGREKASEAQETRGLLMLRIFVDQDFDHDILRGLRLRLPDLDAVTAPQAGPKIRP